jgi:putative ABC transport system ATP-binding protein
MYKLSGVTKNYQKGRGTVAALRGVDLVVEDGEWLAIQGPTGQGKSTLLHILGGLDRPSAGVVEFDGRDLAQLREAEVVKVRAQSIGFIFQTFNLIPTLNALENVEAALVPLHVSAAARRQRAEMALESVGLGDRLRHVPGELSGGQQQRVAIARALVKEPKVLLADEPTGNLDEDTRDEIIGLLETMWRERGLTMVLVTHDSAVARRAQRIGVMKNGRLGFRQHRRPQPARTRTQVSADSEATPSPAPDLQPPGLQAPDLQATHLEPSDAPDFQAPDFQAPDFQAPDLEAPDFQAPDLEAPDHQAPDFQAPDFQAPDFQAPDLQAPDLQAPDLQAPDLQAPDLPDLEAADPSPADSVSATE